MWLFVYTGLDHGFVILSKLLLNWIVNPKGYNIMQTRAELINYANFVVVVVVVKRKVELPKAGSYLMLHRLQRE